MDIRKKAGANLCLFYFQISYCGVPAGGWHLVSVGGRERRLSVTDLRHRLGQHSRDQLIQSCIRSVVKGFVERG